MDLLKRKDGHSAEGQVHNQVLPVTPLTHPKPEQVKGATFEALQEKLTNRNTTCLEGELVHPRHCREGWLTHRGDAAGDSSTNPAPGRGCIASTQEEEIRLLKSNFHHPCHQQHGYFGGLLLFKVTYLVMSPSWAPS